MKKMATLLTAMLMVAAASAQGTAFEQWFDGGTLRIDCLREGNAQADTVWPVRYIDRQARWYGSHTQLLDPFAVGDYRVVVRNPESGDELYSRSYNNLFREYKDTPEGRTVPRRFEETLLLPMPRRKVEIALQHRDTTMLMHDQTVIVFDPASTPMTTIASQVDATDYELHGDPSDKMDIVFVMQGFDEEDNIVYRKACRRMAEGLFSNEPFLSHRTDFNIRFVKADAGVEYNTFGADRYAMTFNLWQLHDAIGRTPADHIIIIVNSRTYGGGAIYNFYSVSSLHQSAEKVLTHELGHGIGGLADEYVDEELSYASMHRTHNEPVEPNITNLTDFGSKWLSLLAPGTDIPTPPADVPRTECGPLGVYEGAGYSAVGVYRPTMHCMMRDYAPFCPVCSQRLEEILKLYTR